MILDSEVGRLEHCRGARGVVKGKLDHAKESLSIIQLDQQVACQFVGWRTAGDGRRRQGPGKARGPRPSSPCGRAVPDTVAQLGGTPASYDRPACGQNIRRIKLIPIRVPLSICGQNGR